MIDKERLLKHFKEILSLSSPSGKEKPLADYLKKKLDQFDFNYEEDDAGKKIKGNTGNIICKINSSKAKSSFLLVAHMDTVTATDNLELVEEATVLKTAGNTILGADDKAGISIILEILYLISEKKIHDVNLEIIFTVSEETGLDGAKNLDLSKLNSKYGVVLDSGDIVGTYVTESPTEIDFEIIVKGKKAHAGVEPEKGINAIMSAAKAISKVPIGIINKDTTLNIGLIKGGEMTNIVPDKVFIAGEIRSFKGKYLDKQKEKILNIFYRECEKNNTTCEINFSEIYSGYNIKKYRRFLNFISKSIKNNDIEPKSVKRAGGSDANIFNSQGLITTNLGIGILNEHTFSEEIDTGNLVKTANIVLELITNSNKLDK